jgi:hypothetical protein
MGTENSNTPTAPAETTTVKLSAAEEKAIAVQAYHDAATREAKAAVVAKYPVLKTIFSDANHS